MGRRHDELMVAAPSHMHVIVVFNLLEKQEMEGVKMCQNRRGEALLSHWSQDLGGSTSEQEPARSGRS